MRLTFVGNLNILPYSPDHAGLIQGMEWLKSKKKISDYSIVEPYKYGSDGQLFADAIIMTHPDLIIHGMTDSLTSMVPPIVRQALPKTKQVMSMWDYRPYDLKYDGLWDKWTLSGDSLDLVTLSNKNQLQWWADEFGVKTMYWPHGCVIKDPEFDEKYRNDCVFVGARNNFPPYDERVNLIDEISKHVNVTWIDAGGGDSHPDRIKVWKDLPKIYHSAKTVLDISHFWDADGYASGRYFYTAGLGGCSITKRFPGCESLYPEGTKLYFDTVDEAVNLIKYYSGNGIDNQVSRHKVQQSAIKHTKRYHSYMCRFEELFKKIKIWNR